MDGRTIAKVIRWFPERGFGFAELPDGQEAFLHLNDFVPPRSAPLRPGDEVECAVMKLHKGPRCIEVRML